MDFKSGGRKAIDRLIEAYGFTTRQALCDHLGVSKSTLATRYMRDIFPAEWIIQGALETGVSLSWLTTGEGVMFEHLQTDLISIRKKKLIDGNLFDASFIMFDKTFLPQNLISPWLLNDANKNYLIETEFSEITDGEWLIGINDKFGVRKITMLPNKKINIEINGSSFNCDIDDINFLGKIKSVNINY